MIPDYLFYNSFPTGSNYICYPPVTNTDIDHMFLVYNIEETEDTLIEEGWTKCGADGYAANGWCAYRKGNLNALLTDDQEHYDKFEAATELAKKRNLLNKEDRVKLFNLICGKQHAKGKGF